MTNQTEKNSAPLNETTFLAYVRTRHALERTMMAWVRTAASLITFGFSVYKFFQFELNRTQQDSPSSAPGRLGLS
jgi:uncharacterized membrane protein YidH (DUF202 family)